MDINKIYIDKFNYMCDIVKQFTTPSNAPDVVQEFYVKKLIRLKPNREITNSWLFVALKNFYIDEYVRKPKISYVEYDNHISSNSYTHEDIASESPSSMVITKDDFYNDMLVCIDNNLARTVFIEHYQHRMSYKQLSEKYNICETTLRSKNFTTKRSLKQYFSDEKNKAKFLDKYGIEVI